MPSDVQASVATSGPNFRFPGDTILSTVIAGNTGAGATTTATAAAVSIPTPTGSTRLSWTRQDYGTPGGSSAGAVTGVGSVNQSLDWEVGEFSVYTLVDVAGNAGSSFQLAAAVTPTGGNVTAIPGLVGQAVSVTDTASCYSQGGGVQLRLSAGPPRLLAGELLLDNETVEVVNGVVRARLSPHARGSTAANPLAPDPDGTGLNIAGGLAASAAAGGIAVVGTTLRLSNFKIMWSEVVCTAGQANTVTLTNTTGTPLQVFFHFYWAANVYADASGNLTLAVRVSAPGSFNAAASAATSSSAILGSHETHGTANAQFSNLRVRGMDLIGPTGQLPVGSYYSVSVYPHLVQGATLTGSVVCRLIGFPVNT